MRDGDRPFLGQAAATGKQAFSVGKPSPVMMRAAHKELGLMTSQTVMIGDTMETDILGGVQMGYATVLVLSGGTRREDLGNFAYAPDAILDSIADLAAPHADWNRILPPTNLAEDSVPDLDRWWKAQAS